jgi:3-isopropylmalate/(R)-2-methylmalate dehydratase large subunit
MGMTMTEKIFAAHAGVPEVRPGQLIMAKVDMVLGNDITAPVAIKEYNKIGVENVFDKDKIALIPDHFTPNKDIKSAEQALVMKQFARNNAITHYYEVGRMGIEHVLLPEQGIVAPGEVIIGADSHTCTYGALGAFSTGIGSTDMAAGMAIGETWFKVPETIRFELTGEMQPWVSGKDVILYIIGLIGVDGALYQSMEFGGPGLASLTMDDRFTIANMAIEAGAKNGIFEVDEITLAYVEGRVKKPFTVYKPDADAVYAKTITIHLNEIPLQVAFPHLPENTRSVLEAGNVPIDQVVIGSCTNGRISDLAAAAKILEGRNVHPNVRLIVIPGTQQVYLEAMQQGYIETFIQAGAVVSTPTCGPCLGGHMGILAKGERALATTNRNFVGRMGHPESEVYLASPAVAAATAVRGQIAAPEEVFA